MSYGKLGTPPSPLYGPDLKAIFAFGELAANYARDRGYILTITNKPLEPLAQGHHESVVEVYPINVRKPEPYDVDTACEQAMARLTAWITQESWTVARRVDLDFHVTKARAELDRLHYLCDHYDSMFWFYFNQDKIADEAQFRNEWRNTQAMSLWSQKFRQTKDAYVALHKIVTKAPQSIPRERVWPEMIRNPITYNCPFTKGGTQ